MIRIACMYKETIGLHAKNSAMMMTRMMIKRSKRFRCCLSETRQVALFKLLGSFMAATSGPPGQRTWVTHGSSEQCSPDMFQ